MAARCLDGQLLGWWCYSPRERKCEKKFVCEIYELVFRYFYFEDTVEHPGKHVQQTMWDLY